MVEVAGWLPNSAHMVLLLNERKTITELHLDELFPHGTENPLLVLRDEHGRLLLQEPVEKRDEAHVIPFLKRIKGWKLSIRSFHIDGCLAYFNAIHAVFGRDMPIQYDYFHIIQNIWRTLYSWLTTRRRALKSRARYVLTPWYEKHLQGLAQDLWTNRYLLFKNPAHLTVEEQEIFNALLKADPLLRRLRGFLEGVWHIFLDSRNEQEARAALQALKKLPIDRRNPQPFRKVIKFLEKYFDWMITFLRYDSIQRNGLSETGMRTLRRLEFAHDGFRSNNGRDCFFRIYQAINYLDWPIYQTTFFIPPSLPG